MKSILLYGPENSSKYKKAMELILPYSKSGLKYKRKIEITLNGEIYYYNISDVHFDIDFELLGTIVNTMELGIVLCRNFHKIDPELLVLFHTFMRNPKISFLLCTRHLSFIPRHIKEICQIIVLKKEGNELYGNQYKTYCDKIVDFIKTGEDLFLLRELIYQLFTYNYDIHLCLQYIHFEILRQCRLPLTLTELVPIVEKYNTKYRSIYHLEHFCLTLKLKWNEGRPL